MAKNKTSIFKNILKSLTGVKQAETLRKAAGTLYGKLRHGMDYGRGSRKIITEHVRRQMRKEGRGAIGQEELSKELAKRRKILKKEISKKIGKKKISK